MSKGIKMSNAINVKDLSVGDEAVTVRFHDFANTATIYENYKIVKLLKTRVVIARAKEDGTLVNERRFIVDKYGDVQNEEGSSKYYSDHFYPAYAPRVESARLANMQHDLWIETKLILDKAAARRVPQMEEMLAAKEAIDRWMAANA